MENILSKTEIKCDLNNDEMKQFRVSEVERDQYQFARVEFRGGDSGNHFTTNWWDVGVGAKSQEEIHTLTRDLFATQYFYFSDETT